MYRQSAYNMVYELLFNFYYNKLVLNEKKKTTENLGLD